MSSSKIAMLCVVIALLLGAALAGAQEQTLPQDCVAYVHCENLGRALDNLRQFIDTIQPGMGQTVQMLIMQVLKNPMMMGVDQSGSFSLVVLNPEKYDPPQVAVIPYIDQSQILTGMTGRDRKIGPTETGVTAYARQEFDKEAFDKATPEQKQNFQQFMKEKKYFIGIAPRHVVYADNEAACALVTGWIKSGTLNLMGVSGVKADFVAGVSVSELMRIYRDKIKEKIAPLKGAIQMGVQMQQPGAGAAPGDPMVLTKLLDVYLDGLISAAEQIDMICAGLQLGSDGMRIKASLTAKDGTTLSDFFLAQQPAEQDLLRYLKPDAVLVAGARMKITDGLREGILGFLEKVYDAVAQTPTPEEKATIIADTRKFIETYTGDFGFALFTTSDVTPGMTIVEIIRCTDVQSAIALMSDEKTMSRLMNVYKSGGNIAWQVTCKRNVETYRGIAVHELAMLLGENTPPQVRQRIANIYGDPMVFKFAAVNNLLLVAFGKENAAKMREHIDLMLDGTGGVTSSEAFKAATASFPPKTNLLFVVNGSAVQKFMQTLPAAAQPGAPAPQPQPVATQPWSSFGAYAVVQGNKISGELFIPMQLIIDVKNAAMGAFAAGVPPGRPPAPKPAPQPAPAP